MKKKIYKNSESIYEFLAFRV